MKMLLMFAVAAVLSGLSESSNITRCGLGSQLNASALNLVEPAKSFGLNVWDLVAKIVCYAEVSTGFNTSAVKELALGREEDHPRKGKRQPHHGFRPRGKAPRPLDSDESSEEKQQEGSNLYGLFQLSDHVICSDGVTRSPNICGTNCTAFIDDDITDDITCLGTVGKALASKFGLRLRKHLAGMVKQLLPKECYNVSAADYFAAC